MNTRINLRFVENYKVENRKKIEKYLSNKYPNNQLKNEELKYDFEQVNADFIKEISKKNKDTIDYSLIDKLPKINLEINENEIVNDDADNDEEKNTKKINDKISKNVINKLSKLSIKNEIVEETDEIDEIDKNELEREKVGDKYYYLDYNRGFIYDLKFNIVGNVDTDTGEIQIE